MSGMGFDFGTSSNVNQRSINEANGVVGYETAMVPIYNLFQFIMQCVCLTFSENVDVKWRMLDSHLSHSCACPTHIMDFHQFLLFYLFTIVKLK